MRDERFRDFSLLCISLRAEHYLSMDYEKDFFVVARIFYGFMFNGGGWQKTCSRLGECCCET